MGKRIHTRPMGRGMAALMATIAVLQIRPATGAPGDIFVMPAPGIGADPPKASDIKDGDSSVSTQTGALQYSYPIQVPPGRNGMAPQLALSYSSQAPTYGGIAAGWSLSIPIITEDHSQGRLRTRSSMVEAMQAAAGVDPKKDDRFASSMAGGRPLIPVTEPAGVDSDVYMAYRAQNDTSFTRYERMVSTAPYRWRARTTDGNVLIFGDASHMPGCYVSDHYAPLTSMTDRFGNEVRYVYTPTAAIPGECKLLAITWGRNVNANLEDFALVVFSYDTEHVCNGVHANSQIDYRSGVRIVTGASRLRKITAIAHQPGNPNAVVHTREINLGYDETAESCNRPYAPVRLLKTIQESAWGIDSPRVDLPPVKFDYNPPGVTLVAGAYQQPPWTPNEPGEIGSLGWGFRRTDDRWSTVESMFLDIDGDGLQDLVQNASSPLSGSPITNCVAEWYRNTGPKNGSVSFEYRGPITLPRLKWRGNDPHHPPAGAAAAGSLDYKEGCSLNGQVTAFMNSYPLAGVCHHEPGESCVPGSDPSDSTQYCAAGGTRCPEDPGLPKPPTTLFRTYLAYRWLDMDSDGLVDLVAAVHGDIDSYDIERGNRGPTLQNPNDYRAGEPSMFGIPGLNQWPSCPAEGDRCKQFEDCLELNGARTCDRSSCTTDWGVVLQCFASEPTTGCARVLMKQAASPDGMPKPGVGVRRHPYERCEGRHPWFIYKNLGNGVFAETPIIKYQPVPLESSSGDSALGTGGMGVSSENHAIMDFDGDGWLDAVVRGTKVVTTSTSCTTNADCSQGYWCDQLTDTCATSEGSFVWQVWLGDGTGGFGPQMHVFPTRSMSPCPSGTGRCEYGGNAISGTAGTWGQSTLSMAGLADLNGDGSLDHWIADETNKNANIAFNYGDEIGLVPDSPPTGELSTPAGSPGDWIKPGNDTRVCVPDPNTPQVCQFVNPFQNIVAGRTSAATRAVDVDHDGRVDIVTFASETAIPKVHFNLGGQFAALGVNYGSGSSGNVDYEGLRRRTEVANVDPGSDNGNRWRLKSDLIDLDGDGIAEGVHFDDTLGFRYAKPESSQPPRLLREIDNGRGLVTTITYAHMHDEEVVVQAPDEFWPDGRPMASPRAQWVVKSLQVVDSFANTNATTQYKYTHPRYGADDSGRYSFRGFREVMTTKPGPTGAPNGARTIQRYAYDVDWSGRLVETVVMPSVAEGQDEARTIDTTEWQELTLFDGAIKTYHASVSEHFVCANGQTEQTCKQAPAGYTRTTNTYTAYPSTPTPGDEQLWVESGSLLQASPNPSDGDRQTTRTYQLDSSPTFYMVYPFETVKDHRVGGAMVMFARSRQTWDLNNRTKLADEVWTTASDVAITRYEHDPLTGNRTKVWKPVQWATNPDPITNLQRTTFTYDSRQLFVSEEINELGHVYEYEYEYGTGTKLKTIGPNAGTCASNPSTCPAGTTPREERRIRVDGFGRMIERWEPNSPQTGGVVSYTPIKVETNTYVDMPSGSTPTYVTHTALIDSTTNQSQDRTELDGHGRPIKKIVYVFGSAPADQITTFHYGHDGTLREVRVPDPSANDASTVTYRYGYDSLGRPTRLRRPDASLESEQSGINISYDGLTSITEEVVGSAGGQAAVTRTTKDSFGRLVTVEEKLDSGDWAATTYEYDPADNITTIVGPAPESVTTYLKHDFAGRRIEITRANRTWKYGYDANGNLTSITSPTPCAPAQYCELDYTTTIAYDALDRPTSKFPAPRDLSASDIDLFGLLQEEYVWDYGVAGQHGNYKGRLISWGAKAQAGFAVQVDRQYNAQGNVTSEHVSFNGADYNVSRERLHEYAPSGLLTYTNYGDFVGGGYRFTRSTHRYDRRGLPSSVDVIGAGSSGFASIIQTRNVAGLVTRRSHDAFINPVESLWTYDKLGRVRGQDIVKVWSGATVARQTLEYFGNDDPKMLDQWLGDSNNKIFEFSYDQRHQLTEVRESSAAFDATYEYNEAGRFHRARVDGATTLPRSEVVPRDVTYQYNGADPEQVTALVKTSDPSTALFSYAYDLAGNQTIRCEGELNGTTCSGESIHYLYDGKDQLRRATKKDANGNTLGIEEYWYDEANQRVAKVKRDNYGDKTGLILWTGPVEAHYDKDGNAIRVYSYIGMGTPVARVDRTSPTTASLEYQFHGLADNTLAAVAEDGTINASFVYAPFGEIIEATDAGAASDAGVDAHRRRMNDKFVDEISGLAYYGFRYYDKTSMTWTQSDPLYRFAPDVGIFSPRRQNLYSFSLANPLRYLDPDGRDSTTCKESVPLEGGGWSTPQCTTTKTLEEETHEAVASEAPTPIDGQKEKSLIERVGGAAEDAGDALSVLPGVDGIGDAISAAGALMQGDLRGAAISVAAIFVPVPGAGKVGKKAAEEVTEQVAKKAARAPGPTVDPRTGQPVGRFIVDPKGNTLIEPAGGATVGNPPGTFVETRFPNGSPAQQLHGPHRNYPQSHGHGFKPGPGVNERGPSLDPLGNEVPYDSPAAHWPVNR